MEGMPPQYQQAWMQATEELEVRAHLANHQNISRKCFGDCVSTFRSKALSSEEDKCISNCARMFLQMQKRTQERFQEWHLQDQQEKMQQMQQMQQNGGAVPAFGQQ